MSGLEPRVTAIIPVFNVEAYVGACLASVSAQTWRNLEIIVVDDGSTDDSPAIVAGHAAQDPRVRVLRQENAGLSAARNAGLEVATGDWICFVDSDDFVTEHYVEGLLDAARNADAQVASCAIDFLHPNGDRQVHTSFHALERVAPFMTDGAIDLRDKRILTEFFPSAWNKIYRRELFARLRYPEGLYYEDHPVFFAIGCAVDRWGYTPEPLYVQRRERDGSITQERSAKVFDIIRVLELVNLILARELAPDVARPLFKQVALRLLWERTVTIPDPVTFEHFAAEGAALLQRHGVAEVEPLARDAWIPSALARRLAFTAPPARPFCSVVLVFENDEPFLSEMLSGLAEQRLRDVEVLAVDNGAVDGASAIARRYAAADPRFRLLKHRGHLGGARNVGLAAARGDYVAFLEGNDLVREDGLERLFSHAADHDADVVACGFHYVGQGPWTYHSGLHHPLCEGHADDALVRLLPHHSSIAADLHASPITKLFRRRFLLKHRIRFERGHWFEEHPFWCDITMAGPRIVYTPEPLVRVRDEPGARRIWQGEAQAWDALKAIRSLARRVAPPLLARLAVRLAWERLSFSLQELDDRALFAWRWRTLLAAVSRETLLQERDLYVSEDFVDALLDLAERGRPRTLFRRLQAARL